MDWNYNLSTYVVPSLILLVNYFASKSKIKNINGWLLVFWKSNIFIILFAIILYFLDVNKLFDSGWAVYSILFFAIPAFLILSVLLIYFKYIKKIKAKQSQYQFEQ